jgi:hypothetical protein
LFTRNTAYEEIHHSKTSRKLRWLFTCKAVPVFLIFYLASLAPKAQDNTTAKLILLKGYISNQNGEPLPGVSIQVKDGNIATTSGSDGSFELQVPANSTVTLSSVGYLSKDIKIGNADQLKLTLQLVSNKNELDQVVVVGYGTRKRSDVTGAITSISEQSIKDVPSSTWQQPSRDKRRE